MIVKNSRWYPRRGERWTKAEYKRLRQLFPKYSAWRLMLEFGRTPQAIAGRAYRLGLKKDVSKGYQGRDYDSRRWTEKEIAFLTRHHKKVPYSDIAVALDRSSHSVIGKAVNLELKRRKVWTAKELEYLKKIYHKYHFNEVAKLLGRSKSVVYSRAKKMNIVRANRPWSDAELKFLRNNYRSMKAAEISGRVGHPKLTVRTKAASLGLTKKHRWTKKEMQYIRRHYEKKGMRPVAEILGRSLDAVQLMAAKMGIRCIYWTKDEEYLLRKFHSKNSNSWLARKFKKSIAAIQGRARKLGLSRMIKKRMHLRE